MKFLTPCHIIVATASMGGKTTWTLKLLKERKLLFDPVPNNVYYFFNEYNESFSSDEFKDIKFIRHLPDSMDEIAENSICVFDDFMRSRLFKLRKFKKFAIFVFR